MNETIHQLIQLRLSVAVLGQGNQAGWWDCRFLGEAGLESLDYNFPKAPLAAAFTATCLAAKRLHDGRIGRTGVTHLFRFDSDLERRVEQSATRNAGEVLRGMPIDRDTAMTALTRLGGDEIDSPEGPVQIGTLEQVATQRGISEMARHYHAGFRLGLRIFPYFASRRA